MRLLSVLLLSVAHLIPHVNAAFTCQPSQPCWPTLSQWDALNKTVSGRLRVTHMLSSPCFPSSPDFNESSCAVVRQNYNNGLFRQSTFGSLEITQNEACGAASCFPGTAYPPAGQTCSLGRLSALHVVVEEASDVTATIAFARAHGIRIVVKNTGHDYLGRSAAPNTLGLWVSKLKNMEFHPSFAATDCPASNAENIGVIGAGVTAAEAVGFFGGHGMMVTTGGCTSVGIAGGYGQGGGHGPLSPTVGMMVDQAVEFDVVTMDGQLRTINRCRDADLFFAMRGGGGSSYAVLLNYKFKLHAARTWAVWRLDAAFSDTAVMRDVLTALATAQPSWSASRIAGYNAVSPTILSMMEFLPGDGVDPPLAALRQATAEFRALLANHPGVTIATDSYSESPDQAAFYSDHADFLADFRVGVSFLPASRLITRDNFATPAKIDALVTAVADAMQLVIDQAGPTLAQNVVVFILKTVPVNTPDLAGETSINPAWRSTLWHLSVTAVYDADTPDADSAAILAATRAARDVVKRPLAVQAAYHNEADPNEPDWKQLFWGENYDRLLEIKDKWDPDTVLNCRACVGYVQEDPMYSCYGDAPVPSVPYPFVADGV